MKVRISEIPTEGADVAFPLDTGPLNKRLRQDDPGHHRKGEFSPEIQFLDKPQASMRLVVEGKTVQLTGTATGKFSTCCSRCGEETIKEETVDVSMVLKPLESRDSAEEEDLNFGYYDGKEIDCSAIAEEFLVLNIPFVSLCSPDCKGLCAGCGANLNREKCKCSELKPSSGPFSVLKDLKLN